MSKPHFVTGGDVLAGWRDALLNGTGPVLYPGGVGELARIEFGPGRVVLVGGLPGGGKTALTMQLAIDALRGTPDLRAVVANVEMGSGVLFDRQLARVAGLPLNMIVRRRFDASHADRLDRGICTLESVADRLAFVQPPYDLGNIAGVGDAFKGGLLVLDYLQRIRPPGKHVDRRGSVDALMDYLRQFADAGQAVLCVSAVARAKNRHGNSTYSGDALSLASFRESSELEYGADSAYVLVPSRDDPETVTLRCLKHRYGEPVDILLQFERPFQRFSPIDRTPNESKQDRVKNLRSLWTKAATAGDDDGDGQ